MTRLSVIGSWFSAVLVGVAALLAFGVSMTMSTGVLLMAVSLVVGAMLGLLWPGAQLRTASDVLHDRNRPN